MTDPAPVGAYGLRLALEQGASLLNPAGRNWIDWNLAVDCSGPVAGRPAETAYVDDDEAMSPLDSGGWALLERRRRRTTFRLDVPPGPEALVHPLLSFTGAVAAWWYGLGAFHAGAFTVAGEAWAVVGPKGAGKSSLLAALAAAGHPVVCDDLLVVREGRALAGPRTVDLRTASSRSFPNARQTVSIGGRMRWRLPLAPIPPESTLAGWLALGWSDVPELIEVPVAGRMALLAQNLALQLPPRDLPGLLSLTALPMLRFSRPRELAALGESTIALVQHLSARASRALDQQPGVEPRRAHEEVQ